MIAKVQTSKICAQKMHFTIVGINLHFLFVLTETKLDVGENLVVLGWFLPWRIVVFFRADSWALDNWAPGPNCPGPNISTAIGYVVGKLGSG